MADTTDSDSYAHAHTIVEPGQDLELGDMNTYFPYVPENIPTSIEAILEGFSSNNASVSQYVYPPPPVAYNYLPHPYPDPSVQTMEQLAVCYAQSNANLGRGQVQPFPYPDHTMVTPSRSASRNGQERGLMHPHGRNIPMTQNANGQGTHTTAQIQRPTLAPHQNHEPPRVRQPIPDPCRDGSTPYFPGHVVGRRDKLQHLTDVLTDVVERPSFACDKCKKTFKNKSGLGHHKGSHDPSKKRQHKCQACSAAFRYPKDLKKHADAKHDHGVRLACADCDKVYKRKDHLDRHARARGHGAFSQAGLSTPVTPVSPAASTQTFDRSVDVVPSSPKHRIRSQSYGFGAQAIPSNEQLMSHVDPSMLQVPSIASASFTTRSIDDTSTVSDVDSQPLSHVDPSLLYLPLASSLSFTTIGSIDDTRTFSDINSYRSEDF